MKKMLPIFPDNFFGTISENVFTGRIAESMNAFRVYCPDPLLAC